MHILLFIVKCDKLFVFRNIDSYGSMSYADFLFDAMHGEDGLSTLFDYIIMNVSGCFSINKNVST